MTNYDMLSPDAQAALRKAAAVAGPEIRAIAQAKATSARVVASSVFLTAYGGVMTGRAGRVRVACEAALFVAPASPEPPSYGEYKMIRALTLRDKPFCDVEEDVRTWLRASKTLALLGVDGSPQIDFAPMLRNRANLYKRGFMALNLHGRDALQRWVWLRLTVNRSENLS